MRILIFGAGPMGSLYAHLLNESGQDVTVLARGERYAWISENGLALRNEVTGRRDSSRVKLVRELEPGDDYDLVIVLIRKNNLPPVLDVLAANPKIKNVLFMGNNALGFEQYIKAIPIHKVLFGFPGAGGGLHEQVVRYADREKPRGRRKAVTIGEINGQVTQRTSAIKSLFESAGVPVTLTTDIDGWLKYHVALVNPLAGALYRHDCDNYRAAQDKETIRAMIRAAREGGCVLRELGFMKRQPFFFNFFYWQPEFMSVMAVRGLLQSKFAEVAFAMHARAARDEMVDIAREFQQLTAKTSVDTPNIDLLTRFPS